MTNSSNEWSYLRQLTRLEFIQSREQGRPAQALNELETAYQEAGHDPQALETVWERLQALDTDPAFPYHEPSDLAGILAQRAGPAVAATTLPYSDDVLYDRLHGAWLARCCGCALGKPVETLNTVRPGDPYSGQQRLKDYLLSVGPDEYPLRDYIPSRPARDGDGFRLISPQSTREQLAFMEPDDDIRYTCLNQLVLRRKGRYFTSGDVAAVWLEKLPIGDVCTAEALTYRNLVWRYQVSCGGWPAQDIDWDWVATHHNSFREMIGAQIRADSCGYAAPGDPAQAAEFAWRDARISHTKNGIYGEMFVAAMIAAAFVADSMQQVVKAGLSQIPARSRLYAAVREVISICAAHHHDPAAYEAVLSEVNALLSGYNAIHTVNNAGLVVAALLLGERDVERVITIAVMGGLDTDCNGATAGSICGAMVGAAALPTRWTAPLQGTLRAGVLGYDPIAISACARHSLEIVQAAQ